MRTKAYGYLRVSGKSQIDGDGFPRQRAAISIYAAANDLEVIGWYEERAVGGATEWEDRPAWALMISALNGVRTILIEQLDRLAREYFIQEYILRDLRKRGITLIPVMEPDIDSSPSRVLFRQIMGSIAEYDKTMIVQKLRGSRERKKAATGRCEGQKPYGHYPGEAEVLQEMRSLHDSGENAAGVTRLLNERGLRPRKGRAWHPYVVGRILAHR